MTILKLTVLAFIIAPSLLFAQVDVNDLSAELDARKITLVSPTGNGNSSGASVTGCLINQGAAAENIDINLSRPLYLLNNGSGQNMIATQVYLKNGGYRSDGRHSFITLQPKFPIFVQFIAYCVDFKKDNPTGTDVFSIGVVPPSLNGVMANINKYARAHPKEEFTCAAQVAIWLAQGQTIAEIQSKFSFTTADESLARSLLK